MENKLKREAWNKGKVKKVRKVCNTCNLEYEDWISARPKYCSRKCFYESEKGRPSGMSGKKWTKSMREKMKDKKGVSGAKSHFWKGGIDKNYPGIFRRKLRYLIKQRDNFQCNECKKGEDLIVHHIDGNKFNNSLINLITMCRICHGRLHAKQARRSD